MIRVPPLSLPSFSKINWHLEVVGRRRDGFHELRTVFQTLDLCDHLSLEVLTQPGIQLSTKGRAVPQGPENLLVRALQLLGREVASPLGFRLELDKRIPVGGGLGGGSGNAAAALLAANQLLGHPLQLPQLMKLASQLGSDVPFFLLGGTALGWGRGELLHSMADTEELELLVVTPDFGVATAQAYGRLEGLPTCEPGRLTTEHLDTTIRRFRDSFSERDWRQLRNDLEGPVFRLFPPLAELKRVMIAAGCDCALLCGSGSSIFGIGERSRLHRAADLCRDVAVCDVVFCRTLSKERYRRKLAEAGLEFRERSIS